MDIAFDRTGGTTAPAVGQAAAADAGHDWHGLRARLAAGWALRAAMNAPRAAALPWTAGSFNGDAALAIARYIAVLPAINPVFWANRKPSRVKEMTPADKRFWGGQR